MKMNSLVFILVSIVLLGFFISNCKKDDPKAIEVNISGVVQKGPFISGSSILMSELNLKLNTTGNVISSQVINSSGYFESCVRDY